MNNFKSKGHENNEFPSLRLSGQVKQSKIPIIPSAFHALVKPTGAICNLDCAYCFYLEKEALYPNSSFRMTDDLLEIYIKQLMDAHRAQEVTVNWQGGEPTLIGLPFFERMIEVVHQYKRPYQTVIFTLQTNGTTLNEEWCSFFKKHKFLIGLSVDGPRDIHNSFRVDKQQKDSFDRVLKGWKYLREYRVDYNILCTINAVNVNFPVEVYQFLRDELEAKFIQFIPIVKTTQESDEQTSPSKVVLSKDSVAPLAFGHFLSAIYDEWLTHDIGEVFVPHFESALANWMGYQPGTCVFSETCGLALAMEHTGDLYCCDHYVDSDHYLGNIRNHHLLEMVSSRKQWEFGKNKVLSLPQYCLNCDVRFACHGGCPKNRLIQTPDGEEGLNYLCEGYKIFFNHISPSMKQITEILRSGKNLKNYVPQLQPPPT